jgi:hypothetical protein
MPLLFVEIAIGETSKLSPDQAAERVEIASAADATATIGRGAIVRSTRPAAAIR